MGKKIFVVLLLVVGFYVGRNTAFGAVQNTFAPTIVSFTCDLPAITMADAESGIKPVTLSWQVNGLTAEYHLDLQNYINQQWTSVLVAGDAPLAAKTSRVQNVSHPLGFQPPSFRLVVLDAAGTIVEEWTLSIPYAVDTEQKPDITGFSTSVQTLTADDLMQNKAQVLLSWTIVNRPPGSNLIFEQILDNGSIVTVELPRPHLWLRSVDNGTVSPVYPGTGGTVRLRMRLVNLLDSTDLAVRELSLPVTGTATPQSVSATTAPQQPQPTNASAPVIRSFTASPDTVDRGATITLNWEVYGTSKVQIDQYLPGSSIPATSYPGQPTTGSMVVTLPPVNALQPEPQYIYGVKFMLVTDHPDVNAKAYVQIRCSTGYFFTNTALAAGTCPLTEPRTIPASVQTFDYGMMVWRSDTSTIYALMSDGTALIYQASVYSEWSDEPLSGTLVPNGLLPGQGFGKVWKHSAYLRSVIGWATASERPYTMKVQDSFRLPYVPITFFALPDGSVLNLDKGWQRIDGPTGE